jgi:hypothetical protein
LSSTNSMSASWAGTHSSLPPKQTWDNVVPPGLVPLPIRA